MRLWPLRKGCGSFAWHVALTCPILVPNNFKILPYIRELRHTYAYEHWNCTCNINLWDRYLVLSCDQSSWYIIHLGKIAKKYFIILHTDGCTFTFKLQVWPCLRGVVLLHDTKCWYAKHICQVTWQSFCATPTYGLETKTPDARTDERTVRF